MFFGAIIPPAGRRVNRNGGMKELRHRPPDELEFVTQTLHARIALSLQVFHHEVAQLLPHLRLPLHVCQGLFRPPDAGFGLLDLLLHGLHGLPVELLLLFRRQGLSLLVHHLVLPRGLQAVLLPSQLPLQCLQAPHLFLIGSQALGVPALRPGLHQQRPVIRQILPLLKFCVAVFGR